MATGAVSCAAADVPSPRFCCSMLSYGCNNGGGGVAVDVVNRTAVGEADRISCCLDAAFIAFIAYI